ncbi:HAD family phosphatase [Clostridium sediminicola]|uniref:HAD family hydrolase n=1 Tax=Clostridium sediminicola TaxID=3114879 RepID=UPI0031F26E93
MGKIDLVIFDMDGLMFDTEKLSKDIWTRVAEKYGYTFRKGFYDRAIGANSRTTEQMFYDDFGFDFPYDKLRKEKNLLMDEHLRKNKLVIKDGLIECIKYLKENKIKTAVASSSGRVVIDNYMALANIQETFDYIISGDVVTKGKPHPEIFLKCLEYIGVKCENALVLEDSRNGILASIEANIKVVFIPDLAVVEEEIQDKVYQKVKSLKEVPSIIEAINKK